MFGKVFKQIYASSIARDYKVRHIFMDLIVLADSDGVVDMTHESIAAMTGVPIETLRMAISILEKPDVQSRSKEENGARLVPLDPDRNWGWQIVNYVKYRLIASEIDRREKTRNRVRKFRQKKDLESVTHGNACNAREKKRKRDKKKNKEAFNEIEEQAISIYELYPLKVGKPKAIESIIKAIRNFGFDHVAAKTKHYVAIRAGDFTSIPPTPHPTTFFNQHRFNDDPSTWKPNENNASSNKKGFDRNKGTYNEGKAHLYKVKPAPAIPVSDPQRPAIADNAGSG